MALLYPRFFEKFLHFQAEEVPDLQAYLLYLIEAQKMRCFSFHLQKKSYFRQRQVYNLLEESLELKS